MRRVITPILALGLLVGGASAVSAGIPALTVEPSSGPAGTEYTVSGDDCAREAQPAGDVALTRVIVSAEQSSESPQTIFPGPDGSWEAEFTVDSDAEPGDLLIEAECQELEQRTQQFFRGAEPTYVEWFDYQDGTFTVTQPEPEPTDPPATPTSEPPDTLPDATPAPAVVARPTFTG